MSHQWTDDMSGGGGKRGWLILAALVVLGWLAYLVIDNATPVTGHHRPAPSPSVTRTR